MRQINFDKEAIDLLRRRGFTEREIARLYPLRRTYGEDERDQPALDRNHLEFARWLVITGRLTEQVR